MSAKPGTDFRPGDIICTVNETPSDTNSYTFERYDPCEHADSGANCTGCPGRAKLKELEAAKCIWHEQVCEYKLVIPHLNNGDIIERIEDSKRYTFRAYSRCSHRRDPDYCHKCYGHLRVERADGEMLTYCAAEPHRPKFRLITPVTPATPKTKGAKKMTAAKQSSTSRQVDVQLLKQLLDGTLVDTMSVAAERLDSMLGEATDKMRLLCSLDRTTVRETLREIIQDFREDRLPAEEAEPLAHLLQTESPQHVNTPLLMAAVSARIPAWIYGDTGSGKTTAAASVAKRLGLEFRCQSMCPTTTKSDLLGYKDAGGTYHSTPFRYVYEHGGVFLFDEADNGAAAIVAVINSALANGHCSFPDAEVQMHDKCVILAAANTHGRGADIKYVGRCALDATTLDRFVFVKMDIDEDFEAALAGQAWDSHHLADIQAGGVPSVEDWRNRVLRARCACHKLGLEHIVSPRTTLHGLRLIKQGVGLTHLDQMCLWKGLRPTDIEKVLQNMGEGE